MPLKIHIGGYACTVFNLMVTVSDESPSPMHSSRIGVYSTMITVPALGADRDAPLLDEECDGVVQPP